MLSKKAEYMRNYRQTHREKTRLQGREATQRHRARKKPPPILKPPVCFICGKPIMPFQSLPLCLEHSAENRPYYKRFNGRPINSTCDLCYLTKTCRMKTKRKGYFSCNLVGLIPPKIYLHLRSNPIPPRFYACARLLSTGMKRIVSKCFYGYF